MATVAIKAYYDDFAAHSVNSYIADGHGDGVYFGYNCPCEAVQATRYMDGLRAHWDALRGPSFADATHYQLWLSWADDERPKPSEMLDMACDLITSTSLQDYAAFMAAHLNTDKRHVHISISAFPESATGERLIIDEEFKHALWRQADYICAEHGYSIIDNPSLRQDEQYRKWFENVKHEGRIAIRQMNSTPRRSLEKQIRDAGKRAEEQATERKKERAAR